MLVVHALPARGAMLRHLGLSVSQAHGDPRRIDEVERVAGVIDECAAAGTRTPRRGRRARSVANLRCVPRRMLIE
jgi:hypothetical protein